MSLNKIKLSTVVKKQLQFKMRAYTGVFTSLVMVQAIALIFSLMGPMHGFSSMNEVELEYKQYNIFNVVAFTSLWAFTHSIIMTTKKDWENGVPFVGNGISNDVSNILFLTGASMIAGILTVLSTYIIRVYAYFFTEEQLMITSSFLLTGEDILVGALTMILHLIFLCGIGYFLGTVTRLHRLLPVLLPVILIGTIIAIGQVNSEVLLDFFQFYYDEGDAVLYVIKILVSAFVLFACSMLISRRTEVRR